ncbi:hypothetical protein EYF80_047644 [Liparis tanakae]|uniref:Uncharacterized protein n=1 Tax=Liparis tanakae TaxID=230148 RepID=A0A4Z2FPC9_9TELE|nr:hypothetical protein EYF80_047644 [Liparis tanakae]
MKPHCTECLLAPGMNPLLDPSHISHYEIRPRRAESANQKQGSGTIHCDRYSMTMSALPCVHVRTNIHVPVQFGRLSFQNPEEEQSSTSVPFRENPSSQEKRHRELKLKFPRGWEQFMDRDSDKARMASHWTAAMWRGQKWQCGKSALHRPREVHSEPAVPFGRKPSSQAAVHMEPKRNEPFGSEQFREP